MKAKNGTFKARIGKWWDSLDWMQKDDIKFGIQLGFSIILGFIILIFAGLLFGDESVHNLELERFNERYQLCMGQENNETYCLVFTKDN